jgi:beta-galactosidase
LHNPKDGVYDWNGIANLTRFLEIATEENFYIILRSGPYISAEIDNGGIPYWLATKYPGIKIRANDENFKMELNKWFSVLMPIVQPFLRGNGGKILMVEVEHEYGSMGICDDDYKNHLKLLLDYYIDDKALLFTTDRAKGQEMHCGFIDGIFATTSFSGLSDNAEIGYYFVQFLREVQPQGPLMNSQMTTGEFQFWQQPLKRLSAEGLADTIFDILVQFGNLNLYTFHCGSSFGFWSGARSVGNGNYMPHTTIHDPDAPLDESGDATEKFEQVARVISFVSF